MSLRQRHNQATMIYKFTSKASGDVIMLGPQGDELLRLLGRDPAPKGIIEPAALPTALRALEAAVAAEAGPADGEPASGSDDAVREPAVALRQRLWPVMEMLRRCQAAGEPVVWGV
jgi:hypothetical protein